MRALGSLTATFVAVVPLLVGSSVSSGASGSSLACQTPAPSRLAMFDRHALIGDVDGDGRADRVFTARVRDAASGCGYVLVVVSRGRYRTLTLRNDSRDPGWWVAGTPAVDVLARLDRRSGAEMLVALWEGGSGRRFDAVFTMRNGRIERLDLGAAATLGNVLDFGSGGMAAVWLGCAKDKPGRFYKVVAVVNLHGSGWKVTRTDYAFRNERVIRLFERTEGVQRDLTSDGLLAGCAIATNWGRR